MSYLQGKAVLITGASSGIGAHLAGELARRGCRVGLLARRADRLEELAQELRDGGGEVTWAEADVTRREELHGALDQLANDLGGADMVIANAGFGRPEPPHKFQPGRALATYDVNLLGTLHTVDWALPRFLEAEAGHLVGVASLAAFVGFPGSAAYCGSKAAMRIHFQSLRTSLKQHGITVTTFCPGFIESELTASNPYKMPFLWKTDRAARKMADALERRKGEVLFPWQMKLLTTGMTRVLPTSWLERMLAR